MSLSIKRETIPAPPSAQRRVSDWFSNRTPLWNAQNPRVNVTLLYNLLTLLYSAAQICDFKSTLAHCEFTAVFNDLHISAFLMAHFRTVATAAPPVPKHLLLITLWAVACAVNGRQQHLPPFSSLSVLFLLLNISNSELTPRAYVTSADGTKIRGHQQRLTTLLHYMDRNKKKMAARGHQGLSLWKLWLLKVKDLSPDQNYKEKKQMFSWSPQYGISARY